MKKTSLKKICIPLKAFTAILVSCSMLLSACGNKEPEEITETPEAVTEENTQTPSDTAPADNTAQTSDNETPKTGLTPDDVPYIGITCTDYPAVLTDDKGVELVTGNYYDFQLDDRSKEAYPKMAELADTLNEDAYSSSCEAMQAIEDMSRQAHNDGWTTPFYDSSTADVTRADKMAVSYYVMHDSYQGGAHGYVYFSSRNIDPVTGEDIAFRDVVKDTINFSSVAFEALVEADDSLKKYFEASETDKDYLIQNIDDSIAGEVTLVWTLDYDGIWVYYADYGMGSYVAGYQIEHIKYSDYPEMFNSEYFTFDGRSIDKMLDSEIYSLKGRIKNTESKETASVPSGQTIMTVSYDTYVKQDYTEAPYHRSVAEKYSVSDDNPALKKRLDEINADNESKVSRSDAAYSIALKKEFDSRKAERSDDPMLYMIFEQGIAQYCIRADRKAFSLAQSEYEEHLTKDSTRTITGINIDPETGEDIPLDKVVTDMKGFEEVLKDMLEEVDFAGEFADPAGEELHKQLSSGDLVSRGELSWTLGYEGVTIYLNTMLNYDFYGYAQKESDFFVSFSEHEELFDRSYSKAPGMFAYEIPVTNLFASDSSMNLEWDGKYYPVELISERDDSGEVTTLDIYAKGNVFPLENVYAYDINVFAIRSGFGDYFLYVQCMHEDGAPSIRVVSLGYGGSAYEVNADQEVYGMVKYTGADDSETFGGYVMTSPLSFHMRLMDFIIGMRPVYSTCRLLNDGMMTPLDNMWYYVPSDDKNNIMTAVADTEVMTVNEAGEETGVGAIVAGGELVPYRVSARDEGTYDWNTLKYVYDESRDLDLKAGDGTIFRLHLDSDNGYEYHYKGSDIRTLFNGVFLYPG